MNQYDNVHYVQYNSKLRFHNMRPQSRKLYSRTIKGIYSRHSNKRTDMLNLNEVLHRIDINVRVQEMIPSKTPVVWRLNQVSTTYIIRTL